MFYFQLKFVFKYKFTIDKSCFITNDYIVFSLIMKIVFMHLLKV